MRETGFSHVVITTSSAPQPGGFFAALGWQVHSAALSVDAADFWGADMTQVAERWAAPSGACEVVLLPVANTTAVLRPLDCAVTTPGGLFDINMRTRDSDWAREFLHTHGRRDQYQRCLLDRHRQRRGKKSFRSSGMGGSHMRSARLTRVLRKRALFIQTGEPASVQLFSDTPQTASQ